MEKSNFLLPAFLGTAGLKNDGQLQKVFLANRILGSSWTHYISSCLCDDKECLLATAVPWRRKLLDTNQFVMQRAKLLEANEDGKLLSLWPYDMTFSWRLVVPSQFT